MKRAINLLPLASGLIATMCSALGVAAPPDWVVGDKLRSEMDAPITVTWSGTPLRDTLDRLSQVRHVAIWLDRRIDPGQLIEFAARDVPLRTALAQASEKFHGGVSQVNAVIYIGPIRPVSQLATLAAMKRAEIQKLPLARGRKLLAEAAWSWPARSEPRELIRQLLREGDILAENLDEAVPHDLWPAADLPPLPWADRLTLALAGFGLTYQLSRDGQSLVLLPWPDQFQYEASYTTTGDANRAVAQLKQRYPETEFRVVSGRIHVAGRFEDHEEVSRFLRGDRKVRPTEPGAGTTTFTLKVENQPLGPAAKVIAERVGAKVEFAPELANGLERLISFQVEDASFDALWQALAKSAGLTVKIQGKTVQLLPGEK